MLVAVFERLGKAHRQHHRRLALEREIGEHRAHQRLLREHAAEGFPLTRVRQCLHRALANDGGTADHAVQPRVAGHLDDRRDAATLLPHQHPPGVEKLDLAAGVAAVAHLVLEPLQLHGVPCAVRPPARHVEARWATVRRVRDHEVRVAHRRRVKPLVAAQQVLAAAAAGARRGRGRGVGPHIRAPLLLGHSHADPRRGLLIERHIPRVVTVVVELLLELGPQRRLLLQHRDARLGHRRRAQGARLDLAVQIQARCPGGPASRALVTERHRDQSLAPVHRHQRVPARVELHLVDAPAARIEDAQLRHVPVGGVGEREGLGTPQPGGVCVELRHERICPGATQRVAQGGVGGEKVVVRQFVELIADVVGLPGHSDLSVSSRG